MDRNTPIYVAGHRGLAGSAIMRALSGARFTNVITRTHDSVDLINKQEVNSFFDANRPKVVVLCAAKVGGIQANRSNPYDFYYQNVEIQNNVINAAHSFDVERLIFLASSCIYPTAAPQPLKEEYLLTGALEPTNHAYALAKIAGIEFIRALRAQFGRPYIAIAPNNLYGIADNYNPETSHVFAALIRKATMIQHKKLDSFEVWGSGTQRREFMCSDDLGAGIIHLLDLPTEKFAEHLLLNIGHGTDCTIAELAEMISKTLELSKGLSKGLSAPINFDASKPDGMKQKLLDVSKMKALGFMPKISLEEGILISQEEFLSSAPTSLLR